MIQKVKWGEKQWIEGVNAGAVHEPVNVLIMKTFHVVNALLFYQCGIK